MPRHPKPAERVRRNAAQARRRCDRRTSTSARRGGVVERPHARTRSRRRAAFRVIAVKCGGRRRRYAPTVDVEMQQVAGLRPFIALNHRARIELTEPVEAGSLQHASHRRARQAESHTSRVHDDHNSDGGKCSGYTLGDRPSANFLRRCPGLTLRHDCRRARVKRRAIFQR